MQRRFRKRVGAPRDCFVVVAVTPGCGNRHHARGTASLDIAQIIADIPTVTGSDANPVGRFQQRCRMRLRISGGIAGNEIGGTTGGLIGSLIGGGLGILGGRGKTIEETGPDGRTQQRQVGFYQAIKRNAEVARDRVADLTRQQSALRKELLNSSVAFNKAFRAGEGDLVAMAPASFGKAYQQDLLAVQKLDKQRLDLNEKIANSYRKLSEISSTMSARAISLADGQIKAEQKLSETLRQQEGLRVQRVQAITKETGALGLQVGMAQKMAATTEAVASRVACGCLCRFHRARRDAAAAGALRHDRRRAHHREEGGH